MHTIPFKDRKLITRVISVLDKLDGTYYGVGGREKYLVVDDDQYQALIDAGVIKPNEPRTKRRGEKTNQDDGKVV